jgi:uncharacterized membrane protein YraQ (UPF0718 family)
MFNLLKETLFYVLTTLIHNGPILAFGILVAAIMKVYLDPEKFKAMLTKRAGVSIPVTVAFGAFTPFCACGTMAVVLSMLTTALPWGPIMAFLTSSPLMSPDEFILYSGIVSVKFAIALATASVIIGIGSGYITHLIEKHTHFLDDQARFAKKKTKPSCCGTETKVATSCGCTEISATTFECDTIESKTSSCGCLQIAKEKANVQSCGCSSPPKAQSFVQKYKLKELFRVFYEVGIKQVLVYFAIFAAIGFMINRFIPAAFIMKYFGSGNKFAVPLLALIGIPLYVSGSSAIPLITALMAGGASSGALLAFMITGPGTSAGVIAGIATIMKKRALVLYVGYLLVFAIVLGYLYDFLLMLGI